MNLNVDYMNISNLEQIRDILNTDFDDFWNYSVLKDELNSKNSTYFVVKNETSEILGFAGIKIILDEAEIMNIVTKKDCRNQGVGKLLLDRIILEAKNKNIRKINLEVNENNTIAIHLYEKFGFNIDVKRKNYYNNGNAILMSKILEK